jgi:hypothetical protein
VPPIAGNDGQLTIFFNIFLWLALPLLTTCAPRSLKTFDCRVQRFLKSSSASRLLGNAPARSINPLWPYFIHTVNQVYMLIGTAAKVIDFTPHHVGVVNHIIYSYLQYTYRDTTKSVQNGVQKGSQNGVQKGSQKEYKIHVTGSIAID